MCHPYEDLGVEQIHSIDDNLNSFDIQKDIVKAHKHSWEHPFHPREKLWICFPTMSIGEINLDN